MIDVRPFLIGDEWRADGRQTFDSVFPADGSVAARVAVSTSRDVDDAVAAARRALDNPAWRDLHPHQRAALLLRLADLIDGNGSRLAELQTRDNGKPFKESLAQVGGAVEFFRYYAAVCETAEDAVVPSRGAYHCFVAYHPIGVVAAITPWNSPLTLEAQKLAPALAAGNAVILKSSEVTPQIGLEYGRLALEAGFPPGVVNVVTGHGDVGRMLVEHPGVDMISFTGGTVTGRAIAAAAGNRGVPALLELGGKSPNAVFADADLDHAVPGILAGFAHNAGQSCNAGTRVFVERSICESFTQRLVAAVKSLVLGDPFDPRTDVASLSSFQHRDRVEAMLAASPDAEVLCGGGRPRGDQFSKGAYFLPSIVRVTNDHPLARHEIFGPVACLIPFEDEADLVRMGNDNDFGLACGIWTKDFPRALRIGRRINTGTVWINTYKVTAVNVPFGGNKASGYGREGGVQGMRTYMTQRSFYVSTGTAPVAWPPSAAPVR